MKIFKFLFILLFIYTTATSQTKDRLPCIDKTFSIVAHIVNDSLHKPNITEAAIRASLIALNKNFAPICVSFEICEFRYIENFSYNEIKEKENWIELQNQFHVKNRINIYFVQKIITPPSAAGFAGLGQIGSMNEGGIVIVKGSLAVGNVMSHEMGHYFGLLHTFEGNGTEYADGSNAATAGDMIKDTPADPYVENDPKTAYVDANCKFISMKKDAHGQYYDPIVGNIMSYYPPECACGFTDQQYIKMANTYLSNKKMW